jgi:hypothetical protein
VGCEEVEIRSDESDEDMLARCPFNDCRDRDADETAWKEFEGGCVDAVHKKGSDVSRDK